MSWWKFSTILAFAAALGILGCGSGNSSSVTITISPISASVITNRTQLFSGLVSGSSNTAITWTITCTTGVAANSCGSIDATGLYTAPATIPTIPATTSGGTPTIAPVVTVTGTAQADTSKFGTATLTIVTGISITITPTSATVGTGETFLFAATVNNPGCNTVTSNNTCDNVTWTIPTPPSGSPAGVNGSIGSTTGVYTAPTTLPGSTNGGNTIIITATSVADTSVTATATVNLVTATIPTITSVSPNTTALGALFQDVYITGTNFISTEKVYINNVQLAPSFVTDVSSSVIRARIPDLILAAPPPPSPLSGLSAGVLQIGVSEQNGGLQTCTGIDTSLCNITVVNVRPGVAGPTPTTISQGAAGGQSFTVDGGFFGTGSNPAAPAVNATFNGQLRGISQPPSQTIGSTRRLSITIGGGSNSTDFTVPGLYPVAIKSNADPSKFAVTNLAIQPTYTTPSATQVSVGSMPSDVAINPATGIAVVANNGSNDITLVDINPLDSGTPKVIGSPICTAAVGLTPPCPSSQPSGPTSVAIDYVRNKALVVNSTSKSIAVVDLGSNSPALANVFPIPLGALGVADTPEAVGVNPVTGRALVAMQQRNYGVLFDEDYLQNHEPSPFVGIVSISTGSNTRVAVEPHLNWALATPGTLGSLGIVDLNQQSMNNITAISRTNNGTANVVTVTVDGAASAPPLAVQVGDAVFIQNIQFSDKTAAAQALSLEGFYTVSSVGPASNQFSYTQTQTNSNLPPVGTQTAPVPTTNGTVNYAQPVATVGVPITIQGIAINPETQQAVLVDPSSTGVISFFSLLDQSVSSLALQKNNAADAGTIAAAYNPLTNIVVAVNSVTGSVSEIDPTAPRRLNDGNLFPLPCAPACGSVAVAIDPGTNTAVIANQKNNSVSVVSLGSIKTFSITETSPKTVITDSTLNSGPSPIPQTLAVIGKGLTCTAGTTTLTVQLDNNALPTSCSGSGDRLLTATVPVNLLNSARRFALTVVDSSGNVTNAEDFTVEQSVDVSNTACPFPLPTGVAIDPEQNFAAVSLFGCNSLALINMATGDGSTVLVGSNPVGVAVLPRLGVAVVANNGGSGTASIVNYHNQTPTVTQTVSTGSGPLGAAANDATGEVAIANSLANTVTIVNAVNGGASTLSTGQRPVAVGFNYVNHQVAVAATGGNTVAISGGIAGSVNQTFSVDDPNSVIYDPVPEDCGSNVNGTTTNTTGCFIVASSTGNSVSVIDPVSSIQQTFRIGINPTSIAYNYRTSTLVSTNTGSHTVTVADFLGQKIRAVFTLPPTSAANSDLALSLSFAGALQYAVDIHPFTNVAVIADTANGHVLFVPLPR